ncbi:hypothetical protein, partial [Bacillus thermotolerans]|uniref:hypothetical protein n=1 Tax=Bacillus thermotolerans TaxID=1221996 RepID=UPI001C2F347F
CKPLLFPLPLDLVVELEISSLVSSLSILMIQFKKPYAFIFQYSREYLNYFSLFNLSCKGNKILSPY